MTVDEFVGEFKLSSPYRRLPLGAARAHQAFAADTDNLSWTTRGCPAFCGIARKRATAGVDLDTRSINHAAAPRAPLALDRRSLRSTKSMIRGMPSRR